MQSDMKLEKLQKDVTAPQEDVTAAQEDATKRALRRKIHDHLPEIKIKGYRKQFEFNGKVEDRFDTTAKRMKRLAPTDADKKLI